MNKKELRKHFLSLRDGLPERNEKSEQIKKHILGLVAEEKPSVIFAYAAFRSEPETENLLCSLLAMGKTVALPKCRENGQMDFFRIRAIEELSPGAYGILEPLETELLAPDAAELILVPGAAFDKAGYRLGYGGGYYDRYLPKARTAKALGICFSDCLADELPRDEFDQKVSAIITENGLVNIL